MRPQLVAIPLGIGLLLLALFVGIMKLLSANGLISSMPLDRLYGHHGELMLFGFLGPLIATERYIGSLPFKLSPVVHLMPFLMVLGALMKLASWLGDVGFLNTVGSIIFSLGAVIFLYLLLSLTRYTPQSASFWLMALGVLALLASALVTLSRSPMGNLSLTLLMLGFPVMTILGERVEMSRFVAPQLARRAPYVLAIASLASLLLLITALAANKYLLLAGVALLFPASLPLFWGERTLFRRGERRLATYLGRHLLVAYLWLFVGLAIGIAYALRPSGPLFDASSHAIAVGFVGTMILAHAPLIIPALFPLQVKEGALNYIPLQLLSIGNLLRVFGYLAREAEADSSRIVGISGFFIALALLAFAGTMAFSLSKRGTAPQGSP